MEPIEELQAARRFTPWESYHALLFGFVQLVIKGEHEVENRAFGEILRDRLRQPSQVIEDVMIEMECGLDDALEITLNNVRGFKDEAFLVTTFKAAAYMMQNGW